MTAQITQWSDVKAAIVDALRAREGLAGVQVVSAAIDGAEQDSIQIGGRDDLPSPLSSLGNRARDERLTIRGFCRSTRPGNGEEVIREAREACVALYGEVEKYFVEDRTSPTLGGLVRTAQLVRASTLELPSEDSNGAALRFCQIDFEIETFNRLTV